MAGEAVERRLEAEAAGHEPRVLLVGNPNTGKTTLFNRWAGTRARTGNFPGVTVERRSARVKLGERAVELVDLPGTYSFAARSPEEQVAADAILRERPEAVVVVADATALGRSLYLALQLAEASVPFVLALNMADEAEAQGLVIDTDVLERAFGAPVVPLVATRGEGLDALQQAVARVLGGRHAPLRIDYGQAEPFVARLAERLAAEGTLGAEDARAMAAWALLSLAQGHRELRLPTGHLEAAEAFLRQADEQQVDLPMAVVGARYCWLDELLADAVRRAGRDGGGAARSATDRLDDVLLHPLWGTLIFLLVMFGVFELLYAGTEPLVGAIEDGIAWLQDGVRSVLPPGAFTDLLADGVVAGVGNVLVFVPPIATLFVLLTVLEDCGYLSRVAFVADRLMKRVGLHGKAFVPMLSGFACAVPAILSTRILADRRDRFVTMLAIPFVSCSARLPVYVLVAGVVFAGSAPLYGVLHPGALALLAMYVLSVLAALGAAALYRRTVLRGPRPPFVLELPPYRWPSLRNVLLATWERTRAFLVDAGTIILALTIVLWGLLSYPRDPAVEARFQQAEAAASASLQGEALERRLAELGAERQAARIEHSFAGRLGKAIEPALEPLGLDWRVGIGLLGAFAAREVFVSTLGIVFAEGGDVDEQSGALRARLAAARRADGSPLFDPVSGLALMVFFVLSAQCMSTLAVIRWETGSWRWPLGLFAFMTTVAWLGALLVYQGGRLLGLTAGG